MSHFSQLEGFKLGPDLINWLGFAYTMAIYDYQEGVMQKLPHGVDKDCCAQCAKLAMMSLEAFLKYKDGRWIFIRRSFLAIAQSTLDAAARRGNPEFC